MNNVDKIIPMFNNLQLITVAHAVVSPPLPGESTTRQLKPPGCKTVFVDNIPEKMTEEIIKDIFKICGPISMVRMNEKNFCFVTFENTESVDQALLLSGSRIRIDENADPAYNSKLYVFSLDDQGIKEGNSNNDGNQNSNEREMAMISQQQMGMALPQRQMMHQQAIPYPSYGYSASESYMDPNGSLNANPYINTSNCNAYLYGMAPVIPNFAPFPVMPNADSIVPMFNNLEPITVSGAVLTPPLPGERRTHRIKPSGCRTVFVGNMPEKMTEEIIKDVFKICGPISVVRMSKKNYCHVRFENMESVDQALLLSGFRIRIEENEDQAYNSKLHVDYAIARDDQHDYECLERARLCEERHRQQQAFLPPSPPPIPHFSEHEAQVLAERLRNKDTYRDALQVLITWLERGECNKKSAGTLYSLIQSSHSHVKRLRNEKVKCDGEVGKANDKYLRKHRAISTELTEIEKVFEAARTQKVCDYFTRRQREKMEEMKMDANDLKETNSGCLIHYRDEREMDLSDNEDIMDDEENGCLVDMADESYRWRERVNSLTKDLEAAQQQVEKHEKLCFEYKVENAELRLKLKESKKDVGFDDSMCCVDAATQSDSQLITLISIFLNSHPFGASIDYICSFLCKTLSTNYHDFCVGSLLRKFPHIFREESTHSEKKWVYIGFRG